MFALAFAVLPVLEVQKYVALIILRGVAVAVGGLMFTAMKLYIVLYSQAFMRSFPGLALQAAILMMRLCSTVSFSAACLIS